MIKVTNLITSRAKYVIVEYLGGYAAVDMAMIDSEGTLTKKLNGLQMHWSKDLNETIRCTIQADKIKELVDSGVDVETAVKKVVLGR